MDCRNRVFLDKRMFDTEYVYSVKFENVVKEMILKVSLYNKMMYI